MKRMIDNKEFNELKKDVKDVEARTSDYIIDQVVYDSEAEKVAGFVIKDVENSITYNVELDGVGKQLYQHCITLKDTYDSSWVKLTIVNNDDTSFTISTFNQWLTDKGYTSTSNLFRCVSGTILDSSTFYNAVKGIFLSSNQPRAVYYIATNNISGYSFDQIKDDVFPL